MAFHRDPNKPIKISVAPYDIHCWYAANEKAFKTAQKKLNLTKPYAEFDGNLQGFVQEWAGGKRLIVHLNPHKGASDICHAAAVCAHECLHIVQTTLRYIGEEKPNDEQEAYLLDYIFEQVFEAYLDTTVEKPSEEFIPTVDKSRQGPDGQEELRGVDPVVDSGAGHSSNDLTGASGRVTEVRGIFGDV